MYICMFMGIYIYGKSCIFHGNNIYMYIHGKSYMYVHENNYIHVKPYACSWE